MIAVDAGLQAHMRLTMQYDLFDVLLAITCILLRSAPLSCRHLFSRPAHGCLAVSVGWAAVSLVERPDAYARTDDLRSRIIRTPACEKIRFCSGSMGAWLPQVSGIMYGRTIIN